MQNPGVSIAKGHEPYNYKDPNRPSLMPRVIPAVKVVEALDKAGFPESEWVTGTAVARRESSFVPDLIGAVNPESWDFGLWQISYKWNAHLMQGPKKIGEWDDPIDNAKMAKYLFDESKRRGYDGWRPWHTYTSGNYRVYLDLAEEAVATYKRQKAASPKPLSQKPEPPAQSETKEEDTVAVVIESNSTVGISAPGGGSASPRQGVVVHYPGASSLTLGDHASSCRQQVRNWDAQHRRQGWSGLGYHYVICHHGIVMTGRGLNKQGAHAPGANSTHIGVMLMVANDKDATADQLKGFRDFLVWLAARNVNTANISPHSRWIATTCPGNLLRGRIAQNNWGTGGTVTPVGPGGGGGSSSSGGMTSVRSVLQQQRTVNEAGYSPKLATDGIWGPKTDSGVKWYQKKLGVTADGLWGPATESAHQKEVGSVPSNPKPAPKQKVTVDGKLGPQTIRELQRALNSGRF